MEYYYTMSSCVDTNGKSIIIKGDEYLHLTKVLRKKKGDIIFVTDGELNVYECSVDDIKSSEIICSILNHRHNVYEPELSLTLCLCLLKNHDRFEFAVEKAVEMGVHAIYPVISEFTINKSGLSDSKIKRLNKIALSAMKQSQRCYLPEVFNAVSFKELDGISKDFKNKITMYEFEDAANKINSRILKNKCLLLIGPEGGFSKQEILQLKSSGWKTFSLGARKLRAETAAVISVYELLNI